ncbi:MAG: hypothetical protein AAF576_00840 [Pseudomonadota bacterium]
MKRKIPDPIARRLSEIEWREVFQYDCLTHRGSTVGLDANGTLRLYAELYVFATRDYDNPWAMTKTYKHIDGPATEAARQKLHEKLGVKPDWGKPGAHNARRRVFRSWSEDIGVRVPFREIARRHIPDKSFTIHAIVEFAYFELEIDLDDKEALVLVALPERVNFVTDVWFICHGENAEAVPDEGYRVYGERALPIPSYPKSEEATAALREGRKEREKNEEEATRRKKQDDLEKAKEDREKAEKAIEDLEEELKEAQENLKDAKEKEKEAIENAEGN